MANTAMSLVVRFMTIHLNDSHKLCRYIYRSRMQGCNTLRNSSGYA